MIRKSSVLILILLIVIPFFGSFGQTGGFDDRLNELIFEQDSAKSSLAKNKSELESLNKRLKEIDDNLKREKVASKIEALNSSKESLSLQKVELTTAIDELNLKIEDFTKKIALLKDEKKNSEIEKIDAVKSDKLEAKKREEERQRLQKERIDAKIAVLKEQNEKIKKEKEDQKNALRAELLAVNEELKKIVAELKTLNVELNNCVDSIIKINKKEELDPILINKGQVNLRISEANKRKNELLIAKKSIQDKLKQKDDGYQLVEGTYNWSRIIDIETFQKTKPGTWSISVVAKDSMDNENEEAAINLKIDPKSDIPNLNIINPKFRSRVPGNLMVVGTAYDDDKVDRITMFIDSEKKEYVCTGTDFWYYDLDTTSMNDGMHKLTFKVYDINGVESKFYTVPFILDRKVPLVTVKTLNSGAVVSGTKKVGGEAYDMNGIKSVEFSIDERYSFNKVSMNRTSGSFKEKSSWEFSIDTAKLGSGAQVIWIKATDYAGSEGFFPLTVIIDREKPEIGFNYPANKQKIGDRFTVYGYAKDNVDIKKVTIKVKGAGFNDIAKDVDIIPGNPFWKYNVDIAVLGDPSKFKSGSYSVIAEVTDVADNKIQKELNLFLDDQIEKPVADISGFNEMDSFSGFIPVFGAVKDDEIGKEVIVDLVDDKNTSVYNISVDGKNSYSTFVDLRAFPEGKYSIKIKPKDNFVEGNEKSRKFWIDRSPPKFDVDKIIANWAGKIYGVKATLDLSVIKFGDIKSCSYSFINPADGVEISGGNLPFKQSGTPGIYSVDPIVKDFSKDAVNGLLLVKLTVVDKADNKSSITVPIVIDKEIPSITDIKYDEKSGLLDDVQVSVNDNSILKNVDISVLQTGVDKPQKMMIGNGESKEIVLPVKNGEGKFNSYDITLKAEDLAGNIKEIKQKIKFKETTKTEIKINVVTSANNQSVFYKSDLLISDSKTYNPQETNIIFGYTQSPDSKVSAVYGKDSNIDVTQMKETGVFYYVITDEIRNGFKTGDNVITVKKDGKDLGKTQFYGDKEIPAALGVWPPSGKSFRGDFSIFGTAKDDSGIAQVSYLLDSTSDADYVNLTTESLSAVKNYSVPDLNPLKKMDKIKLSDYMSKNSIPMLESGVLYRADIKTAGLNDGQHNIKFRIKDNAGKMCVYTQSFVIDKKNPGIKIVAPQKDEKVNGIITILGEASDDNVVSDIIFEMNDTIINASGTNIWDGLYDIYQRKDIKLDASGLANFNINIKCFDIAGNETAVSQGITLEKKSDIPVVFINSPAVPDQRYTTDTIKFEGVALDDDGIDNIQYRVDDGINEVGQKADDILDGGWRILKMKTSEKPNWSVVMPEGYLKPGRHKLEVKAFDLGNLQSEMKEITFQIDKENPKIELNKPENGSYLKGLQVITGKAADPNLIRTVEVSTNNGWTFVPAEGRDNWVYYLESATLPDGMLKFLIKAVDNVGSESYSFAMYNIDNTPPQLTILTPKDSGRINNKFRVIGRAKDNISLQKGFIKVTYNNKDMLKGGDEEGFVPIEGTEAWHYDMDTTAWEQNEKYHMIVKMYDTAGNFTTQTIDFEVQMKSDLPEVELDQPQAGQYLSGDMIEIYGTAKDDDGIDAVYIEIDGGKRIKVNGTTNWRYVMPTAELTTGLHRILVVSQEIGVDGKEGKYSVPISRSFYINDSGVVINLNNIKNGNPIGHRPWISGSAKYFEKDIELKMKRQLQIRKYYQLKQKYRTTPEKIPEMDSIEVSKSEVMKEVRSYLVNSGIKDVFLSYDNGNTYKKCWGTPDKWMIRLQTQFLGEGDHVLQFKAVTFSGVETLKYVKISIDRQKPVVKIDKPKENLSVNERVVITGTVDDNNDIGDVKLKFKQFDKNFGKLPRFIEGLYLWGQAMGGPIASGGVGFSFFDNVVRLEALFGWIPTQENLADMGISLTNSTLFNATTGWENNKYEPRFSGFMAGGKLLARIIDIPFEFFFGEDAQNFSISVEVGAGFYWISGFACATNELNGNYYKDKRETERNAGLTVEVDGYDVNKDSKVLAGFMYQIDFFKVERWGILKNFAMYFENSFFFIPSEVESSLTPQFGFGIRNSLF